MPTVRYQRALAGELPAEALTTVERERLVTVLWDAGWSDTDIADWTRMTEYTTARIRTRLGLRPRHAWERKTA